MRLEDSRPGFERVANRESDKVDADQHVGQGAVIHAHGLKRDVRPSSITSWRFSETGKCSSSSGKIDCRTHFRPCLKNPAFAFCDPFEQKHFTSHNLGIKQAVCFSGANGKADGSRYCRSLLAVDLSRSSATNPINGLPIRIHFFRLKFPRFRICLKAELHERQ